MTAKSTVDCDVLVFGDEVESILTAVSAARSGASVILIRRSNGLLGGLSVRGGLSYMDITVEHIRGLFREFLNRTGVVRIALNPNRAIRVLTEMLVESNIRIISGVEVRIESQVASDKPSEQNQQDFFYKIQLSTRQENSQAALQLSPEDSYQTSSLSEISISPETVHAKVLIDATPDADIARSLNVPYGKGLGGLLGTDQNFLGISPVFRMTGVAVADLQEFEAQLRAQPDLPEQLEKALPHHPSDLRTAYITRPTVAPDDQDYLDILNPVIGIDYHCWRHGDPSSYPNAPISIDGANISRLEDGSLGFNGMVGKVHRLSLDCETLINLSQGSTPIPAFFTEEMNAFETYLKQRGGFKQAKIIPPQELYIRQTLTLLTQENMTAQTMITEGVPQEKAIADFSYWLDLRGTELWRRFPNTTLPKPVFNIGLDVTLPITSQNTVVHNLAVVGRSAGYSPLGQGAGRIIQHNALIGEGVGIAAMISSTEKKPLHEVINHEITRIQSMLNHRWPETPLLFRGKAVWSSEEIETNELLKKDDAILSKWRHSLCKKSHI